MNEKEKNVCGQMQAVTGNLWMCSFSLIHYSTETGELVAKIKGYMGGGAFFSVGQGDQIFFDVPYLQSGVIMCYNAVLRH